VASVYPKDAELGDILVGPDSVSWRITSDIRLYFGMLYPLLMQVAHPTVDAGVQDFSEFERDPWNRLLRTVDYVCVLVYGGPKAVAAGRRLRALHGRFRGVREDGVRYSALDPAAYAWVHATLLHTYVATQAHFSTPLGRDEVERFYLEYRGLGRLIGVRERDLPPDWDGFCEYFRHTAEHDLVRTASVEQVLRTVRHVGAPPVGLPGVVWRAIRVPAHRTLVLGGVGLITPTVRRRLGLRWTWADEVQFRALGAASRSLTPLLPRSFKVTGPAQLRWRRTAIDSGPLGDRDRRAASADLHSHPC
jgi:uncharacterized protein (DUF2236 family)